MILDARQKKAEELRRLTDKSASMSEEQLTELRADIKVCSYSFIFHPGYFFKQDNPVEISDPIRDLRCTMMSKLTVADVSFSTL